MTYLDDSLRPAVRLALLQHLEQSAGYRAHEYLLVDWLTLAGLPVSAVLVSAELDWLAAAGLIVIEPLGSGRIAELHQRGQDVAAGRERITGIARPRPGR
jgi:hypothetical protein